MLRGQAGSSGKLWPDATGKYLRRDKKVSAGSQSVQGLLPFAAFGSGQSAGALQ